MILDVKVMGNFALDLADVQHRHLRYWINNFLIATYGTQHGARTVQSFSAELKVANRQECKPGRTVCLPQLLESIFRSTFSSLATV
jgi:hypothetical protein